MKQRSVSAPACREQHTQRPLFGLAVVFAVAYAVPIIWPDARAEVKWWCEVAEWGV